MGLVKIYEVYCQERFIGHYRARSSEEAVQKAKQSGFTGNAKHLFHAKEKRYDSG